MKPKEAFSEGKSLINLQPSWRSYFVFYAAIIIFGIGPSLNPETALNRPFGWAISLILVLFIVLRRQTTYYRITEVEVLRESIFWGRSYKKSLPQEEIADLVVRRGVVHRFLGIGHLQFRSRVPAHPDLWWFGIQDPFGVKKRIEQFLKQV